MPAPRTLLLILLIAGVTLANVLVMLTRPAPVIAPPPVQAMSAPPPEAPPLLVPAMPAKRPANSDADKQIALLQDQIEYLQGQVKTLQQENSAMLDKLSSLGNPNLAMKDKVGEMAKGEPPSDFIPTDYVGLGAELISARELESQPIPTVPGTVEDIEKVILGWLRRHHENDFGPREGTAFAALGVIPEAVDTLPLRAALLARQITGWFNDEDETLYIVEPVPGTHPTLVHSDPIIALSYGALLQQFQEALFPSKGTPQTTDQRLARLALIGGDAANSRLLYQLKNPNAVSHGGLPFDDPDHPLNQVPLPAFLRSLATFPLTGGIQFAQSMHSIGGYTQLSAAYQRPPVSTAEIMDVPLYFADPRPPVLSINWANTSVGKMKPLWDDTLGQYATTLLLRRYLADEAALVASHGWQTDRWLAFANAEKGNRGHVVWHTQWATAEDATKFYKAMRECLAQQYRQTLEGDDLVIAFKTPARYVRLHQITTPQPSVIYIDAGDADFAAALRQQFDNSPDKP